jgi:hypothetical protein
MAKTILDLLNDVRAILDELNSRGVDIQVRCRPKDFQQYMEAINQLEDEYQNARELENE